MNSVALLQVQPNFWLGYPGHYWVRRDRRWSIEIKVFSIRALLWAVGLSSFAVATLRIASPFMLGIVTTVVLIALIVAAAVSVLATGSRRRFWLIFVATCWTYLAFEYGIMHNARLMY